MGKKQRVLLVRSNYLPGPVGKSLGPPLGLLTLAGMIRRERPLRVEVKVVDTGINRFGPEDVGRIIRSWEPDVVGVSVYSLEAGNLHAIAAYAKRENPNITVVAGGPHSTSFYDQLLEDKNIDYAVVGEGELTLIELLDHLYDRSEPSGVLGVAYRRDNEVIYAGDRPFIEDLDTIPMPAWDMVDIPAYSKVINMNSILARSPYATLFTSRACPYKCIYCHGIFGKKFRAQSAERVLDEVELLSKKYGVRELHFHDDVFNFDRDRVMAIADGVVRRGIDMKFAFPNAVRGDLMTRDMIKALARAGVYCITYAVETASERIQRLIRKNLNLDKVRQTIDWTFEENIIPCGFFMFGFPTETREEMEQTLQFALNSKMLKALFFNVVPFPGTEMYEMVKREYPNFDLDYNLASALHYRTRNPYYTQVSGIDVAAIQRRAWISFYLTPWRFYQILRRFPKNRVFLQTSLHGFMSNFLAIARPDKPMRNLMENIPNSKEPTHKKACV